ncbi:hypothetical protein ABZ851_31780 [Streptomyces sp. NPDC047049]|uniref:hypothetical protein n=1 Tax=Streptomyces sp. NPDC047049 TaxID=3156688 RepID=UPI0033EF7A67
MLLELMIDDRTVRLIPLLMLLPAFPAAVGTVRETGYAVGWVLIVITAVLLYRPLPSSYDYGIVMVLAFVLGGLCVVTCHWRIRRERELLRVRSTAVALQRQMLRSLPILTDRVIVDGVYRPVEADRLVGGDVYDGTTGAFYPLEERLQEWADISPWEVADHLTEDLGRHTAGIQRDDITALVVRRTDGTGAPR